MDKITQVTTFFSSFKKKNIYNNTHTTIITSYNLLFFPIIITSITHFATIVLCYILRSGNMVDLCYNDRQLIIINHIKQLWENVYKNMQYWFTHNQNSLI